MFDLNDSQEINELMNKAKNIRNKYFNLSKDNSKQLDVIDALKECSLVELKLDYLDSNVIGRINKGSINKITVNMNEGLNLSFAASYLLVCLDDAKSEGEEIDINNPNFKDETSIRKGLIASYILTPYQSLASYIEENYDDVDENDIYDLASFSSTREDLMELRLKADGYISSYSQE